MTLSTDLYIHDRIDPEQVYAQCVLFFNLEPGHELRVDREPGRIANWPMQGLDAWLSVTYGVDGAVPAATCGDWCDDLCEYTHTPAHYVRVNWDTAYSYRSTIGGCQNLHASYIVALGSWLNEQGLRWSWRNEFTGEIHAGPGFDSLSGFFEAGDDAVDWFETIVKPAIGLS